MVNTSIASILSAAGNRNVASMITTGSAGQQTADPGADRQTTPLTPRTHDPRMTCSLIEVRSRFGSELDTFRNYVTEQTQRLAELQDIRDLTVFQEYLRTEVQRPGCQANAVTSTMRITDATSTVPSPATPDNIRRTTLFPRDSHRLTPSGVSRRPLLTRTLPPDLGAGSCRTTPAGESQGTQAGARSRAKAAPSFALSSPSFSRAPLVAVLA